MILVLSQQTVDINSLKNEPIITQYKKILTEISNVTINKKYVFPESGAFRKELCSNPSKENIKKILSAHGMPNARICR